jgi:hypothetical protein
LAQNHDGGLAAVVRAWPTLPLPMKTAIIAIVVAAEAGHE